VTIAIFRSLLIAILALSLGAAAADDVVVARRGDVTLTASELRAAIASQSAETRAKLAADPASLGNFVQSALISRTLLAQAEAAKWDQTPAVQPQLARAHDTLVVDTYLADQIKVPASYPTDSDIKVAYQQNLSKLMQPRRYHLQQIMIGVLSSAGKAAEAAAFKKAAALRAQAVRPNADFGALAAANSTDKTVAAAKGDMGWVAEDQLLPAIKVVVAGLAVNGVSEPVQTDGGWHVLKLIDTTVAGPASLAQVHDQLVQALRQQRAQMAAQAYINNLLKAQPIQVNAIALAAVLGSSK
jgi:peptidylprolyl isomerase